MMSRDYYIGDCNKISKIKKKQTNEMDERFLNERQRLIKIKTPKITKEHTKRQNKSSTTIS